MVHSKLQLEVLRLYKELLRAAAGKPGVETTIKSEFRRQANLGRTDTLRIEYQMRMGRRKLDMIRDPHVSGLGRLNYRAALSVQTNLVSQVQADLSSGSQAGNTLVLVEHSPVYTTGIRTREYSLAEEERLVKLGAEFVRTNRGGLITFHGPGQLVCYPILNLRDFAPESSTRKAMLGMKWYVHTLEQLVIDLLAGLGVEGERSPHTGVWVGRNKICAMGVHSNNLVTSHGLALNCNTDMAWFGHIVPCGITEEGTGVTSLTRELKRSVPIEEVTDKLVKQFCQTFNCETRYCDDEERDKILSSV